MTGFPLIIAFVAAIIAMILLISKLKVHPFLAIMRFLSCWLLRQAFP